MIKKILQFCNRKSPKSSSAFSSFFNEYSSEERKKVMEKTIEAANKNQKALIEKYEKSLNGSG